jgi:MoxR-like ATPase
MSMFLSLRLPQPLLLEGEAGVGKTEAAKSLAVVLDTPLIRLRCYEGIDAARCRQAPLLYQWIDYPSPQREVEIVRRRVKGSSETLAVQVADAVSRMRDSDVQKPPGVAEAIDWLAALNLLGIERAAGNAAGER